MTTDTATKKTRTYLVLAVLVSLVLVISVLLIVPFLTTNYANQSDNQKRLISYQVNYVLKNGSYDLGYDTIIDFDYVKVGDLQPNSFVWVFNPFHPDAGELYQKPPTSLTEQQKNELAQKIDKYAYYNLIRLPNWLGDDGSSASAYRAYSGISLTQKCLVKYWPQDGRMRLEDPCSGDAYRSWDGYAFGGPAGQGFSGGFVSGGGNYQGLATLDLAVDSDGYITAKRPETSPYSNGIAGEGRKFSADQLQQSNLEMIATASSYVGYELPFVTTVAPDYRLGNIREPDQFSNNINTNPDDMHSQVLEATYLTLQSFEGITITSAIMDSFPSLDLDVVTSSADGMIVPDMNNTELRSLLGIIGERDEYCFYVPSGSGDKIPYSIRYGPDIAGKYAILHAPDISAETKQQSSSSDQNFYCESNALLWAKSKDGKKDIIVQIRAVENDLDDLTNLVKSIQIQKVEN